MVILEQPQQILETTFSVCVKSDGLPVGQVGHIDDTLFTSCTDSICAFTAESAVVGEQK